MKKRLQMGFYAAAGLGALGALLRLWLLCTGFDEKGLLVSGHPGIWLCYVLTVAMAAAAVFTVAPLKMKPRYHKNFPASPITAAGCAAAALGLVIFGVQSIGLTDGLSRICAIAAFVAAAAMLGSAWFRFQGKRIHFSLGMVVCLFFMLALYSRYRQWSSEPQLSLYLYNLLAMILSMLACYQRTALDGDVGTLRSYLGCCLGALFFCCLAFPCNGDWALYLGFAGHFAAELVTLRLPRRSKPRPEQEA